MQYTRQLLDIMARLRDPKGGCPWDLEQTYATIVPYTIEEAYEVAEAIEQGDMDMLQSELGDLLFQVVFYTQMAGEEGHFTFEDVARGMAEKMIRRHPHVFADAEIATADQQTANWESIKAEERKEKEQLSLMDDVPAALPALMRAYKLQKRAARVGFDWPDAAPVLDKIEEELAEVKEAIAENDPAHIEEEIGDLLFVVANLARKCHVTPEDALRAANRKFERRFRYIETHSATSLETSSLDDMEALWQQAKQDER